MSEPVDKRPIVPKDLLAPLHDEAIDQFSSWLEGSQQDESRETVWPNEQTLLHVSRRLLFGWVLVRDDQHRRGVQEHDPEAAYLHARVCTNTEVNRMIDNARGRISMERTRAGIFQALGSATMHGLVYESTRQKGYRLPSTQDVEPLGRDTGTTYSTDDLRPFSQHLPRLLDRYATLLAPRAGYSPLADLVTGAIQKIRHYDLAFDHMLAQRQLFDVITAGIDIEWPADGS